jgi:filamentous hemagglutinin
MRDYDPTTGRYIQADPLGLVDGASVYGYAIQSPMRWTDPTGEAIFVPVLIGLGKAALAAYSSYSAANAAVDGYNDLCHSADGLTAAEAVWLALDLIPGGVGKGAKAGASFGDDLASVTRSAPKGGFGPMRRSVSDSSLENILDSYFGQAQVRGQRVGNGGTADALRYERMTGELLSPAGHEQKARDMLKRIEKWRQRAHNAPNPRSDGRIITAADVRYADELIEDLLDALGR